MGDNCSKTCDDQNKKYNKCQRKSIGDQSVAISYENGIFSLPSHMPFQKQSTYVKIEKAAYNFCQQNNIDMDFMPCITRIIAYRQQKVFLASFKKIPENQKESFMQEVNRIPQDQIDLFYHNFVSETKKKYSLNGNAKKPNLQSHFNIPKYVNAVDFTAEQQNKYRKIGKQMIQNGEVGLVIMCAGSSSRFDNEDKFLAPLNIKINPSLTILDFIFIRLKRVLQNLKIPIIFTCNDMNIKDIKKFVKQRQFYGFDRKKIVFIEVQCLPVLDLNGKYCMNQKYKLIKRPFGTGRTFSEIVKQQNLNWLKQQGAKLVHFIGTQNLMQYPFDLTMLGLTKDSNKKVCGKCVGTLNQWQKLPRYVQSKDKKIYLKLQSQLSNGISQSAFFSAFKFPVATNSIVIDLQYLQQLVKDFYTDIYLSQNYHILRRRQKIINTTDNKVITGECLTFEGDMRDLLACCHDPLLFYVDRSRNYAPIISKKDQYSLKQTVKCYQQTLIEEYNRCREIQLFIKQKK